MAEETKTQPNHKELGVMPQNIPLFNLYAVWKSLPILSLKRMTRNELIENIGISDDEVLDLIEIRTQKEFAQKYDLSEETLVDWNKKLRDRDPLFEAKAWALTLTKNVMMALYASAMSSKDARLFELWFKVVNDWKESAKPINDVPQVEFNINLISNKKDGNIANVEAKEAVASGMVNDGQTSTSLSLPNGQTNN